VEGEESNEMKRTDTESLQVNTQYYQVAIARTNEMIHKSNLATILKYWSIEQLGPTLKVAL